MKRLSILFLALTGAVFFLYSCGDVKVSPTLTLEQLPEDTGGAHIAHPLNSNAAPYGYYMYTPSNYSNEGPKYPLLIFLHGSGEKGNSSGAGAATLDKILVNGPPKMIKSKTWDPKYPMLVASFQCHNDWWDVNKIKQATEFLMNNYAVDTTRIYMTGLSMGAFEVWDQVTVHGKKSHITAAVLISGSVPKSADRAKKASTTPIWVFHGDADGTVSMQGDIDMVKAINELNPPVRAKLTIFPGVGHDAWTRTYTGSGIGSGSADYDKFDMDIYEWMFQYKKE